LEQTRASETQALRATLADKAAALEGMKQRQRELARLAEKRARDEARLKSEFNMMIKSSGGVGGRVKGGERGGGELRVWMQSDLKL
jgi:hypothetical protein